MAMSLELMEAQMDFEDTTVNFSSTVPTPFDNSKTITNISEIPEVIMDNFDLNRIRDKSHLPLRFFLTKCTPEILGAFLRTGFLEALYSSTSWKLYLTELIYGYLNYVVDSQTHPWDHSSLSQYPVGIIQQFKQLGKIIVLRKHVPEIVDLSGMGMRLKATTLTPGLLSQVIQFDLTSQSSTSSITHLGTIIPHDIYLQGCYPEQCGFPLDSRRDSGDNSSQNSASRTVFSRRMKKLAHSFRNPKVQFQLKICDSDKLVDLWYLKHLSDQFSTKIHVTQQYYEFVAQFVSQFLDKFTPESNHGEARIHYDCCLDDESCRLFGSKINTIWINGKAEISSDINLPFIHEL